MSEKSIVYIGEFPPAYGGVTVKNAILYECIFRDLGAQIIDLEKCRRLPLKIPLTLFQIVKGMICAQTVIIGTGAVWRDKLLLILQRILTGKRGMKKISKVVMGGRYHEFIKHDPILYSLLKEVGSTWVESESMVREFQKMGIVQTFFFPNCRVGEGTKEPRSCKNGKLKFVFFSRICIEKGVKDIIAAYERLEEHAEELTLDFYGELEDDIKEDFLRFVEKYENVCYHGVYDAVHGDVYAELNQYDAMLLISKREGVAGALVESKMSGITAIVSDRGCNPETVHDGKEGIVLSPPFVENLTDTIKKMLQDYDMVQKLKKGAYESRKRYCIDTYKGILTKKIAP